MVAGRCLRVRVDRVEDSQAKLKDNRERTQPHAEVCLGRGLQPVVSLVRLDLEDVLVTLAVAALEEAEEAF